MDMIETYLSNLQTINNMTLDDYGDKHKVKRNNKLSSSNRQIATEIESTSLTFRMQYTEGGLGQPVISVVETCEDVYETMTVDPSDDGKYEK